jgi:hypothetical protein
MESPANLTFNFPHAKLKGRLLRLPACLQNSSLCRDARAAAKLDLRIH